MLYKIILGAEFKVDAGTKQEAINLVADLVVEQELTNLYADHYELADCCEIGQTVEEYAEANNLVCAGKHGIYIQVVGLEELGNKVGYI